MKKVLLLAVAFIALCAFTTNEGSLYISHTAHVWFLSKAKLEDIEAHNHQGQAIINSQTGEVALSLQIKSFEFKKEMMQEHFNERYMESDKFPKATFKGKITNVAQVNFAKTGTYIANVEGDMTIHGETKPMKTTVILISDGTNITAKADFRIALADYKISVPEAKVDNIASTLDIHMESDFTPKK